MRVACVVSVALCVFNSERAERVSFKGFVHRAKGMMLFVPPPRRQRYATGIAKSHAPDATKLCLIEVLQVSHDLTCGVAPPAVINFRSCHARLAIALNCFGYRCSQHVLRATHQPPGDQYACICTYSHSSAQESAAREGEKPVHAW